MTVAMCVIASSTSTAERGETVIVVDFASGAEGWPSIDDAVMGGLSSSGMVIEEGFASFRGRVSFDNNGGFASVRSRPQLRDLSAFDGLIVRVRSDGKKYGFRIRTSASFDGVSYQAPLVGPPGEWTDVTMPFSEFVPVWRGRPVAGHPPLDPSLVTTLGLIVSRQEGDFRIDIASIRTFAGTAAGGEGP